MKKIILLIFFANIISYSQNALTSNTTTSSLQEKQAMQQDINRWYYGGTIGFNFWQDYFYLSVNPLVGYQISPEFSVGGKLQYAYISDKRYDPLTLTSNNYGASVFARYRPIYQFYLHSEFAYASYEKYTIYTPLIGQKYAESERHWVPFLLLGGGYVQRIGANASIYAEVLFDVIQDKNSPYESWDPIVSIGAGVGF